MSDYDNNTEASHVTTMRTDSIRSNKILATNVPNTPEGRWVWHAVDYLANREKRSKSKVIFLAIEQFLKDLNDPELENHADEACSRPFPGK